MTASAVRHLLARGAAWFDTALTRAINPRAVREWTDLSGVTKSAETYGIGEGEPSEWCRDGHVEVQSYDGKTWTDEDLDGHKWCASQRWHDAWHAMVNGCCWGPDERASWECSCHCHAEANERALGEHARP